jgi:hypothetical protein
MANPDIHTYGVATRFQPGVSGNKKGRPKGSLNLSTLVQQMLDDEDLADSVISRKPSYWRYLKNKNFASAIVTVMMIKAMTGDVQAATWLRMTGYGNKVEPARDHREIRPISLYDMRQDSKLNSERNYVK